MATSATAATATMYQAGAMLRTGGVDQPGCDERRGSTEDGVGKVEAECEAGET